jgi:hypothetical protein
MTRTADVALRWLVSGRPSNHSPRGQRFSLPARFEHQGEDWLDNAWSLVIEVEGVPDAHGHQTGRARFLVSNAPHHWLSAGEHFTLFEGELPVAVGEVTRINPQDE